MISFEFDSIYVLRDGFMTLATLWLLFFLLTIRYNLVISKNYFEIYCWISLKRSKRLQWIYWKNIYEQSDSMKHIKLKQNEDTQIGSTKNRFPPFPHKNLTGIIKRMKIERNSFHLDLLYLQKSKKCLSNHNISERMSNLMY